MIKINGSKRLSNPPKSQELEKCDIDTLVKIAAFKRVAIKKALIKAILQKWTKPHKM